MRMHVNFFLQIIITIFRSVDISVDEKYSKNRLEQKLINYKAKKKKKQQRKKEMSNSSLVAYNLPIFRNRMVNACRNSQSI